MIHWNVLDSGVSDAILSSEPLHSLRRLLPSSTASPSFPELSWTDVVDTDRYDLWVRNLTTGEDQIIREENLTTTNYQTALDLPGGEYRAWVRAFVGNQLR